MIKLILNPVAFIIPGAIGSVIMWMYFPDTLGKPLEEVAALFGDHGKSTLHPFSM